MLQTFALLARSWTNYIVDIVILLVLICFALVCAKKGFIECFFSFVSVIMAIAAAVLLSKMFIALLNEWFDISTVFTEYFETALLKIKGFETAIDNEGLRTALAEQKLPNFLIDLVIDNFGNEEIPAGTTLAFMVGETFSKILVSIIAFIILFIVARLVLNLLKKALKLMASKIALLGAVDQLLGAAVGLIEGLLVINLLLSVFAIIPSTSLNEYLNNSVIVGWLYNNNLINILLGWISAAK